MLTFIAKKCIITLMIFKEYDFLKYIFPLSYKVNSEKPISVVVVCLIYVAATYLVRFLLGAIPVLKLTFNILSALFTLYVFIGITIAVLVYLKRV